MIGTKTRNAEPRELLHGYHMTELGPLPKEWRVVKLVEVAAVIYGKAKPQEQGDIPVIGSGGIYAWTNRAFVEFPTLVIGRKGAAGTVWLEEQPCWPSDTTFYLEWKRSDLDYHFLYYFMRQHPLSGEYAKTTMPSIQKHDLENLPIPIPPIPEQRAIAHVLRTVQRAKEATEGVIAALRELKKSLTRHLFTYGPVPLDAAERVEMQETEIGSIPANWRVVRLGEVVMHSFSGGTPSTRIAEYWNGNIPWTTSAIISEDDVFMNKFQRTITDQGLKNSSSKIAPKGSLIIGTRVGVGKAVVARFDIAISQDLTALLLKGGISPLFLAYLFKSNLLQKRIYGRIRGTTIKGIPRKDLLNILIPLPPLSEQREIARILQTVDRKIEAEEGRKQALEALFKTLLHDLMTAKVRLPRGFVGQFEKNGRTL